MYIERQCSWQPDVCMADGQYLDGMQAAQDAASQLETAFHRLSESFTAQRAQLDSFAHEQQVHLSQNLRPWRL